MPASSAPKEKQHITRPIFSLLINESTLVEMIFRNDQGKSLLCVSKDGQQQYKSHVTYKGVKLVPYSPHNNLLKHEAILLPSEALEYGTVPQLIGYIQNYIKKYVDVSPLFERIACYYVLFSWVYDSFNELPYLRLKGDAGSGKTRFLITVGSICYKPIFASGASTISPLFRMIDAARGTLIIDEGDFRASDEKSEIIKILNNGNARGFPVLRSEVSGTGEYNPHAYTIFGPKLIATRKSFEDRALETRCLTEEMGQRRLRPGIPINLPKKQKQEALVLRNLLLTFRFRHAHRFEAHDHLSDTSIQPRLKQVFNPLLSIVDDQAIREELVELACEYDQVLREDRGMDAEAQVLEIIRDLIKAGEKPSVKHIADWFNDLHGDDYNRAITPKWIGGIIRHQLQLRTQKSNGVYIIPPSETQKLDWLFEKFGIAAGN